MGGTSFICVPRGIIFLNFQKLCCSLIMNCYSIFRLLKKLDIILCASGSGLHGGCSPKWSGSYRSWSWVGSPEIRARGAPVPGAGPGSTEGSSEALW